MDICVESTRIFDRRDDCVLSWSGETSLQDRATGQEILQLPQRMSQVLATLSQNANAEFQFLLQQDEHERPSMQKKPFRDGEPPYTPKLCIILYGSADVATVVGDWLDQCQLYLQLPHGCDRNVRYLNPHCLSPGDENRRMTFDIENFSDANLQAKDPFVDVLMELECEEIFDESPQPALISTPLHGHQKRALTFMLGRERGWDFTGSRRDLWRSYVDSRGTTRYQNILSGRCQVHPPCPFNGGILGKTWPILFIRP
jgi:SWI/SNF-related matrix-associated actin-dependent regulator of chromatin subfamily A3